MAEELQEISSGIWLQNVDILDVAYMSIFIWLAELVEQVEEKMMYNQWVLYDVLQDELGVFVSAWVCG